MSTEDDWDKFLNDHPALQLPKSVSGPAGKGEAALHLSLSSLPDFVDLDPIDDKPTPSGRRQAIAIKDADLFVAVGSEIRIASLGDSKAARGTSDKTPKVRAVARVPRGAPTHLTGSHSPSTPRISSLKSTKLR